MAPGEGQTGGMQPMTLSDEQREFRRVLRQFCEERVAPHAAEADEREEFSWDTFKALQSMDLTALQMPAEYGGSGADLVTQAIAAEELARVDASACLMYLISKLGMLPVINFGSEEMKNTYIPRIASGESQCSYALSEPDAGSDVASMTTRAVRDGDDYVITGNKVWITNAGISDLYTVFAKTDPSAGHRGISAFLVERDWGIKVGKLEKKMGVRGSPTGEVIFEDVRVPAENMIGAEGEGFRLAMATLDRSRPTIGAQAVGIAQAAIDYASGYLKERRQFGRAISDFQGLQFMVADMAMKTEAARGLVYRACAIVDEGDPRGDLSKIGAMAKCFASDVAMLVTTDAVQLLGGYGYTTEFPVERMMRDAKITQIYEGTNQIQRIVMAKRLLG